MSEENSRGIFEPFYTTKMDVGTGLGLSTVYGTLQHWGGRIEVESALGEGTVFTLCLPLWQGEESAIAVEESDHWEVLAGRRILLVDDDEVVLTVLERMLRKLYEVTVCHRADEMLEAVEADSYDVALIDLGMPDMLGDELADKVRALDPRIALVLMSGWSIEDEGMPTTAFDFFLPKPFGRLKQVRQVVREGVQLSRRRLGKGAEQV